MGKPLLDQKLLSKLGQKTGKSPKSLREQISRRANKSGISSEAAQILWAKEQGISTATYQRRLPLGVQQEVQNFLPSIFARPPSNGAPASNKTVALKRQPQIAAAIDYLLEDKELRDRCKDLLKAKKHYDRAIREATTVLDDRLKKVSGIKGMLPQELIGKVVNPDPQKAIIVVSSERSEQEGIFSICKGLGLSFRNPTHHNLSNEFTQQDAMKFCGFIDAILVLIERAKVQLPTAAR
jgi:uncharacterized protein (TIGR02391 family)